MARPSDMKKLREEVEAFLLKEAELLDELRYREWLELLTPDVHYLAPVRITREREKGPGLVEGMAHFDEDYASLEMRILRLETEFAWAEDPPSRTRHHVSNIRVGEPKGDEIPVRSYLLLFRSRGDSPQYDLISCERHDILRRVNGNLKLAKRVIVLDHSSLPTHNLAVFL